MERRTKMTLTPQDIQSKQFHTAFRGFDIEEVDGFLEKVAEEMLILNLEAKQAKEKIEALEKEIEDYKKQEKTFKKAILSAQKISDEIEEKTRKEAEETLSQAKKEAEEMLARAREESDELRARAREEAERREAEAEAKMERLKNEIETLSRMREEAVNELRGTLNRYLAAIDRGDFSASPQPAAAQADAAAVPHTEPAPPETEETAADQADAEEPAAEPDRSGTVAAETAAAPEKEAASASIEDDLSDLYQKIDMLELEADEEETRATLEASDLKPLEDDEAGDDDLAIPELDGELLFNLDDPLDDLEPSIAINPEKRPAE